MEHIFFYVKRKVMFQDQTMIYNINENHQPANVSVKALGHFVIFL